MMKKIPLILVYLCLMTSPVFAFSSAIQAVISTGSAGSACESQTMGYTASGAGVTALEIGAVIKTTATSPTFSAPCTGALKTAHIVNEDTRTDNNVKVCVYDGSTLIACSASVTGTAANPETLTAAFSSGTVSSATAYNIVLADDDSGGGWSYSYDANTATTAISTDCTTFYDSPPATESCTWSSNLNRRIEVWVDVE
jgi:hypothetical protein